MLSGQNSPLPQLASLLRRLQRKASEAPGLLDEVVKSLDEALISLDAAQSGVEAALRATEFDPQRAGTRRGAAVCAARRLAQVRRRRSTIWPGCATRWPPISPISTPAKSGSPRWKSRPPPRATPTTRPRRGFPELRGAAADRAEEGGDGRTAGAEARTRRVPGRDRHRAGQPRRRTASTRSSSGCAPTPARGPAR